MSGFAIVTLGSERLERRWGHALVRDEGVPHAIEYVGGGDEEQKGVATCYPCQVV